MTIFFSALLFYLIPILLGLAITKTKFWRKLIDWDIFNLGLILIVTFLSFTIWTHQSPSSLNWDLYEHQTLSNLIQEGQISFFTSHISDTFGFNSYPPLFHSLLALAQKPFNFEPKQIVFFWKNLEFIHLFLVGAASYALAQVIFKQRLLSLINGLLGVLIFDSVLTFSNFFVLPQTFTALLFVFFLSHLISHQGRLNTWQTSLISTLLIFNHYIVGTLAATIYLSFYIYYRYQNWFNKIIKPLTTILLNLLIIAGVLLLPRLIDLSHINQGEAAAYTFNLQQRHEHLTRFLGYAGYIFFPLGFIYLLIKGKCKQELLLITFMSVATLGLSIVPIAYSAKFFVIGRYFFILTMSVGIFCLLSLIKSKLLKMFCLLLLVLTFTIQLTLNSFFWKKNLSFQDQKTHLSPDEIAASKFLKSHYSSRDLIISDPSTQYILEALSGVNSAGGAFATTKNRELIDQLNQTQDLKPKHQLLNQVEDKLITQPKHKLFIVSGRYFVWQTANKQQKMAFDYNVWIPHQLTLTNLEHLQPFLRKNQYFKPIYQNNSLIILEINQKH